MSAYNGSGTFVITGVGLPYVTATTISSTVANQLNTDLATGLSTAITKDGQTTPTANIPLGGFKITGIAAATVTGDALSYGRAGNMTTLTLTGGLTCAGITSSGSLTTSAGAIIGGDITCGHVTAQGAGGGSYACTGFGITVTLDTNGLSSNIGAIVSGTLKMINTSNGVELINGGVAWSAISDERRKTNLNPIFDAVEKVNDLRAVTGRFYTDEPDVSRAFLIAQDVQKVLPEAVAVKDDGTLLLAYTDVIPLLVAAIKELSARLDGRP